MSAIFGIYKKDQSGCSECELKEIADALVHRKVDGGDLICRNSVALGQFHMFSTPESHFEKLPMQCESLLLTADVRIDNRDELIPTLQLKASAETPLTDADIILAAYQEWGEKCPEYLIGEFAFVIYDELHNNVFCARDHIGFRPFYYYQNKEIFIFASEKQGVYNHPMVPRVIETDFITKEYKNKIKAAYTFCKDSYALLPGHSLSLNGSNCRITRYWEPKPKGKYKFKHDDEWALKLKELIIRAVHDRLRTDYPVGICLSGGLDSSAIAIIAARYLKEKNQTLFAYSSALDEKHQGVETDERHFIQHVVGTIPNINHRYVIAKDKNPFTDLEHLFEMGQRPPAGLAYMNYAMFEEAQAANNRHLFTGTTGDFFASYTGKSQLFFLYKQARFFKVYKIASRISKVYKRGLARILWNEVFSFTRIGRSIKRLFGRKATFPKRQADMVSEVVGIGQVGNGRAHSKNIMSYFNLNSETPLADKRIVEFFLDVPPEQFLINGYYRSLYRRAMEGILPDEIRFRITKDAFSPDYHRRVLDSREEIGRILNKTKNSWYFDFFLQGKDVLRELEKVKPVESYYSWDVFAQNEIEKPVVMVAFIHWLINEKGFSIVEQPKC
jgi:asparagine synthase (glutamine-hydrolysing)